MPCTGSLGTTPVVLGYQELQGNVSEFSQVSSMLMIRLRSDSSDIIFMAYRIRKYRDLGEFARGLLTVVLR